MIGYYIQKQYYKPGLAKITDRQTIYMQCQGQNARYGLYPSAYESIQHKK